MAKKVIRVNVKSPKVTSNKKASPIKVKINMKNTEEHKLWVKNRLLITTPIPITNSLMRVHFPISISLMQV